MSCKTFLDNELLNGEIFLFRVPKRARQKILAIKNSMHVCV
jgi:hypothetical protein